jgi:hypothetical protein
MRSSVISQPVGFPLRAKARSQAARVLSPSRKKARLRNLRRRPARPALGRGATSNPDQARVRWPAGAHIEPGFRQLLRQAAGIRAAPWPNAALVGDPHSARNRRSDWARADDWPAVAVGPKEARWMFARRLMSWPHRSRIEASYFLVCGVLQSDAHALGITERCAPASSSPADRCHCRYPNLAGLHHQYVRI